MSCVSHCTVATEHTWKNLPCSTYRQDLYKDAHITDTVQHQSRLHPQ